MSRKDNKVISVSVPADLLKEFDAAGAAHCKSIGIPYRRSVMISMCMLSIVMDYAKKEVENLKKQNKNNKEDK